jgi:hypothetical protein
MEKKEVIEWTILGRKVGSASGWDIVDTFVMMLYDFVPVHGIDLPRGDINFDFENGVAESFNDDGQPVRSVDLVTAISGLPIQPHTF